MGSKCLRCGADASWLQGAAPPHEGMLVLTKLARLRRGPTPTKTAEWIDTVLRLAEEAREALNLAPDAREGER